VIEADRLAARTFKASVIAKYDDGEWREAAIPSWKLWRPAPKRDRTADRGIAHANRVVAADWLEALYRMDNFWVEEEIPWYLKPTIDYRLLTNLTDVYSQGP
jgi:hypothetical protein